MMFLRHLRRLTSARVFLWQVNPLVVQTYKSAACFATCWLALLVVPMKFTWWGLVGASIWVRSFKQDCTISALASSDCSVS